MRRRTVLTLRSVTVVHLPVSKAAPLARDGCKLVPLVELNVLNGVTQSDFVDSCAASLVTVNFDNRKVVDQLLRVAHVGHRRQLKLKCKKTTVDGSLPGTDWVSSPHLRTSTWCEQMTWSRGVPVWLQSRV